MKRMIFLVLCVTLVTDVAIAAPPTLQSVAVTPAARSLSVGQKQRYTATGTFSDGSTRTLGGAIGDIAPGEWNTCVLLTSGGVDCWGKNSENGGGQLGDGSTVDSLIARPVKWITTATAVAFGMNHVCALLARGAVQCWGSNPIGQLGNGNTANATRPVRVIGIDAATALALGQEHSCALLASGRIQCWGDNLDGQLGDGTNTSSSVPVPVTGVISATGLAAGGSHSCALLASGAARCWGSNEFGQLGNGTTTDSAVPVTVEGLSNATAIVAGAFSSCALLANGEVKCWGYGGLGQLGTGSSWPYPDSSVPVRVGGINTAVAITAGALHACAVLSSGSAQCWGYNYYGQLGNGSTAASNAPVPVSGIRAPVRLVAGWWHTCSLQPDGAMRCWGRNNEGQLGNRRRSSLDAAHPWPVNVIGTPGVVWQSSDPSKVIVTMRGLATARSAGNTTITATTSAFVNDNAVLTVNSGVASGEPWGQGGTP